MNNSIMNFERLVYDMAKYWCRACQQWLEEEKVTEKQEQLKRGTPLSTVYIHDSCGNYVAKADENNAV